MRERLFWYLTAYTSGATDANETGLRATWGHEFVCVDFAFQLVFRSGNHLACLVCPAWYAGSDKHVVYWSGIAMLRWEACVAG